MDNIKFSEVKLNFTDDTSLTFPQSCVDSIFIDKVYPSFLYVTGIPMGLEKQHRADHIELHFNHMANKPSRDLFAEEPPFNTIKRKNIESIDIMGYEHYTDRYKKVLLKVYPFQYTLHGQNLRQDVLLHENLGAMIKIIK